MRYGPLFQTTYQELARLHAIRPHVEIEGSVMRVIRNGSAGWVARKRVGDNVTERWIGADTDEGRAQADRVRRDNTDLKEWRALASASAASLRSQGAVYPDQDTGRMLLALSGAGLFQSGAILGGTNAFRTYRLELGRRIGSSDVMATGDVDLIAAVSVALPEGITVSTALTPLGDRVRRAFGMSEGHPDKWVMGGVELEFLSPVGAGSDSVRDLPSLGVRAQALKFIEFSMKEPIRVIIPFREGVEVIVPAPERYALHKLIVADRRTGIFRGKSEKDLDQAQGLISILAQDRPEDLAAAWEDLVARGPAWRNAAGRSLAKLPSAAEALKAALEIAGSDRAYDFS